MIQVLDLPSSHEHWAEKTGHIFLTWTIFNPHGPTVCCAGWYDEEGTTEKTLFVRWLHFLAGRAVSIGTLDEMRRAAQVFRKVLGTAPASS